jgi:hypothetical protein
MYQDGGQLESSAQSHAAVQRPKEVAGDPTLLRGGTEAHKVP